MSKVTPGIWFNIVVTLLFCGITANFLYPMFALGSGMSFRFFDIFIAGVTLFVCSVFIVKWFFPGVVIGGTLAIQGLVSLATFRLFDVSQDNAVYAAMVFVDVILLLIVIRLVRER